MNDSKPAVEKSDLIRGVFLLFLLAVAFAVPVQASEIYGNFETLGVIVDCPPNYSPAQITRVRLYLIDDGKRKPVQDAFQVGSERYYASSLFFLKPDTEYQVLVEFYGRKQKKIHEEILTGRTRPEPEMPTLTRKIFVSPDGNDRASGSLTAPMKTVAGALGKASPGTAVVLREGIYYEGDIYITMRGTSNAPIVITAFKDEKAVIDGSDPTLIDSKWNSSGNAIFSHAYQGKSNLLVFEEKQTGQLIRACPMPTLHDLRQRKSAGKSLAKMGITAAYYCDGQRIYVLAPKPDMQLYRVHVAARTRAFEIENSKNIFVNGIDIRYFGKNSYSTAIYARDSSDITIQDCRFTCTNAGIWLKGNCDQVTVQSNEFFDDLLRWHFGYIKGEESGDYNGVIETGAVNCDGKYAGRGLVVRHNRIEGLFDGVHLASESDASKARGQRHRTHETDFYNNEILGACDDLIEVDGYARNVRVFDNRMTNCLSGISIAQALDGPTWILYNSIAGFGVATGATLQEYEGYPVKTNGGLHAEIGSGYVIFYHNTSWTPKPRDAAFLVKKAKWRKLIFRNNIWCGQSAGFVSWQDGLSPIDMKNDIVYSASGPLVKIARKVSGPGPQQAGVMLDFLKLRPNLAAPNKGDYTLRPGSPAIDRGILIPGINDSRYKGTKPDIGWHEQGLKQPRFGTRGE